MLLNIDLGTMYVKTSVIDSNTNTQVISEVIRLERDQRNISEVLINTLINKYDEKFNITQVYILPNLKYIDCELVTVDSMMESKYKRYMDKEIKQTKRIDRLNETLDEDSPKQERRLKEGEEPFRFKHSLNKYDIFHMMEDTGLMTSDIYIEYIDSSYLSELTSMVNIMGKEVSVVSPYRRLKYLPFQKVSRIVIDYGHKFVIGVVIEVDKYGEERIVEVLRREIDGSGKADIGQLIDKHSSLSVNNDNIYEAIHSEIKELMTKYPHFQLNLVGGMSNFLQKDLLIKNDIIGFNVNRVPTVLENLTLGSTFSHYPDIHYNTKSMDMKNKVLNIMNLVKSTTQEVSGSIGNLVAVVSLIGIISMYGVVAEGIHYKSELQALEKQVETYEGSNGTIAKLNERLDELKVGRTRNYYNVAEFLETISSPLEFKSIEINGKDIKIQAEADNVVLIQQFLNTVKLKQAGNKFTRFTLEEESIKTIYKNGRKLDHVTFVGTLY